MDTELLAIVCDQDVSNLQTTPAVVHDYVALWVVDDHYPVLQPSVGAITQGLIIRQLSEETLDRIVFFEGGEFSVQTIEVVTACGTREQVQYFADNAIKPVSDQLWQLGHWQRTTKADTLPRVRRYMQCYGKLSVEEADAYW